MPPTLNGSLPNSPRPIIGAVASTVTVTVPVTWGTAILRHGLVQLHSLLQHVLLFVVLAVILLVYFAIRSAVATPAIGVGLSWWNLGAVAPVGLALCTPSLHRWLSDDLNRLVYGRRGSPGQIVAELIQRPARAAE